MGWWNFKVFTTTKIFVIVILFGAGTDYCLFLIARYKEELATGKNSATAIAASLGGVGAAVSASALTTIFGLATMYCAQFGKFRNSGPAIGLCLFVTLMACITLAPALLRGLGSSVYWTIGLPAFAKRSHSTQSHSWLDQFWTRVADLIVKRPVTILVTCTVLMLPFCILGSDVSITYDLLSELSPNRVSKRGAALLRQHFPVGESGPIVVLAHKPGGDFDSVEGVDAIRTLTMQLYVDGVQSVRSLSAPAGKRPTKRPSNLQFTAQNYRLTQERYVSQEVSLNGGVARFDLVLGHDPFSLQATEVLQQIDQALNEVGGDQTSYWCGSRFVFAGTTAAIRDLREVTSSDNVRIQVLVVLAVLLILLVLLRRPAVCFYLVLSVLFSYYVTIGATELFFHWSYGETYEGLDWKVPLFLFVILVAIGQDYNIYLATRVFEETKTHGLFGGLRQAIVRTGGIITSCGIIMAGTFLSMMSGTMRGIVELGFALTLGVLLDTFIVRPILVPAFLAILFRFQAARSLSRNPQRQPSSLSV
jgi:RND superfamily putative drug exporter